MRQIIIVGAGQAGAQAAATLRSEGYDGSLLLVGAEPHPPYERPPLSKAFLKGELPAERLSLRKSGFYADKQIELLTARRAVAIDRARRTVQFDDGNTRDYDQLLLATGSEVRRLELPGGELPGVCYLRSLEDATAIHARLDAGTRLAIIGGGYIGLEVAASARQLGCSVSVLELAPRVMARVAAAEMSTFFERRHREAGVDLRLGCGVTAIEGKQRVEAVCLADGTSLPADLVVIGVGILPSTTLAEAAGLDVADGIVVNRSCRTSDEHIYAAGDVASQPCPGGPRRIESVPNAIAGGRAAARAMLGSTQPSNEVPWFWSDQYELKLQIVGLAGRGDQRIVRRYDASALTVCYVNDEVLTAIETVNRPADFIAARKLIGQGRRLPGDRLADPELPLKALLGE